MSMTQDQMVKVMEALAPEFIAAIRAGKVASPQTGQITFSEDEREFYPAELIKVAESVCPSFATHPSLKQWRRAAIQASRKLREAHSETALAFLLRKGVQTIANDWYNVVPREWQDYAGVTQSNTLAEFYPPLYGSQIAGIVPNGERFPEGRIIGENSVLMNYKFGLIESFDRELFDDDQTAQIRLRASRLGQSMALTENIYAAYRFIGAKQSYGSNLTVAASGYSTTDVNGTAFTGPWSTAMYGPGTLPIFASATPASTYGNIPTVMSALGLNGLKLAWSVLLNTKDPLGNKIIVNPNTLLVSSMDALHAPMLVAPPAGVPYYPSPIGQSFGVAAQQTASSATAGQAGGVFGANPFMGLGIKVVVARFLADWAWALGEKGKGFMWQERDALEVVQENPAAGAAFEVDAYRFRSRRRFESDWIGGGSRFWFLGNAGLYNGAAVTVGNTSVGATAVGVSGAF